MGLDLRQQAGHHFIYQAGRHEKRVFVTGFAGRSEEISQVIFIHQTFTGRSGRFSQWSINTFSYTTASDSSGNDSRPRAAGGKTLHDVAASRSQAAAA